MRSSVCWRGGWGAAALCILLAVADGGAQSPPALTPAPPRSPADGPFVFPQPVTVAPPLPSLDAGAAEAGKAKKDEQNPKAGEKKDDGKDPAKGEDKAKGLTDSLHCDDNYGLKLLFDSLHPAEKTGKHWYEKLSVRGYIQPRYGRTVDQDPNGADPNLSADRSINGNAENFSVRRARMIFSGDVSDYLSFYWQHDFAVTLPGTSTTFFGQARDLYADVYLDKPRAHRFRVGLSKVPFGWENMQSSQNRVPLDRTDPINTGVSLNERDLGVFYYWTPEEKQKLLKDLVDGGLKGSGNYGIFALGVYNGQGLATLEQNLNPHVVARATWPFRLPSGQVVETSVQGYTGDYVVSGAPIRPLGVGTEGVTPTGTGGNKGFRDQRVAATFVWYPQPFGFQTEWNWGQGPGLNDAQTAVETRSLQGGYAMVMYKHDTNGACGIFTPYCRWQYYRGGYKSVPNAPYGTHDQWDVGIEWQIRKEMELVVEYSFVDGMNVNAIDKDAVTSYRNFVGGVLRCQFQINY